MLAGLLLIIFGVTLIAYPELLSIIVASFFILSGLGVFIASAYFKRASRRFSNPYANFFIKF